MNWMRVAATPTFKKLWGRIETNLKKSESYTIEIKNKYKTSSFGGTKGIVFSTANEFGGKNFILSYFYIVFGVISIIIGIAFGIKSKFYPEKLPDLDIK